MTGLEIVIPIRLMLLPCRIVALGSKAIYGSVLVAIFALLFKSLDGRTSLGGIASVDKITSQVFRPQHESRISLFPTKSWRDPVPILNPSLLKVDYKQNLLVWPVVAANVTRSPPFTEYL